MPDISLLPALCRVLGTSSDTLLGMDGGHGLETLAKELRNRLGQLKQDKNKGILNALKYVLFTEYLITIDQWTDGLNLAVNQNKDLPIDLSFVNEAGFACKVCSEILSKDMSHESVEKLRTILSSGNWEVALQLLSGSKKEGAFTWDASQGDIHKALGTLMDVGLITQTGEGYQLAHNYGLAMASILKAICVSYPCPQGIGIINKRTY